MARHPVNAATAVQPHATVAAYLDDLATRLRGTRRRREQIVAELRDGLDDATDQHIAAGLTADQAAAAAIAQFGTPQRVADAFAGELTTAYARRTIARYVATGPLVGIWWLLLLNPDPWRTGLIALIAAIPVLPLIAIAIATAGGTIATTGRLIRWLPETSPHRALTAVIAIAALSTIGDLTMLSLLAASTTAGRPLAAIAIAASLARVICSIIVIRDVRRQSHDGTASWSNMESRLVLGRRIGR
jgi:hypothetical protein